MRHCINHPKKPAVEHSNVCEVCTERRRNRDGVKKPFLPESVWKDVDWSKPIAQIAQELGVSGNTVRSHKPL